MIYTELWKASTSYVPSFATPVFDTGLFHTVFARDLGRFLTNCVDASMCWTEVRTRAGLICLLETVMLLTGMSGTVLKSGISRISDTIVASCYGASICNERLV
jgi:hypothetical protein